MRKAEISAGLRKSRALWFWACVAAAWAASFGGWAALAAVFIVAWVSWSQGAIEANVRVLKEVT